MSLQLQRGCLQCRIFIAKTSTVPGKPGLSLCSVTMITEAFDGYIYCFLNSTWVGTQLVERSLTWESVRVKGSEIQSNSFVELNGFFHEGQQGYNLFFFFFSVCKWGKLQCTDEQSCKILHIPCCSSHLFELQDFPGPGDTEDAVSSLRAVGLAGRLCTEESSESLLRRHFTCPLLTRAALRR